MGRPRPERGPADHPPAGGRRPDPPHCRRRRGSSTRSSAPSTSSSCVRGSARTSAALAEGSRAASASTTWWCRRPTAWSAAGVRRTTAWTTSEPSSSHRGRRHAPGRPHLRDVERGRAQAGRSLALMADPSCCCSTSRPRAGPRRTRGPGLTLSVLAADPASPATVLVSHHVEEIPPGFTHALLLRGGQVVRPALSTRSSPRST